MIEWTIRICHRPGLTEREADRYERFKAALARIPSPWGIRERDTPSLPQIGAEYSAVVVLTPAFDRPVRKAFLEFPVRQADHLRDEGWADDKFIVVFDHNDRNLDFTHLVRAIVPAYISAWDAYFAEVYEGITALEDAPINSRNAVSRIWPANFWDRELCRRAFGLSPEEIVQRLSGHVAEVRLLEDGVLVIDSTKLPAGKAIKEIETRLRPRLSTS